MQLLSKPKRHRLSTYRFSTHGFSTKGAYGPYTLVLFLLLLLTATSASAEQSTVFKDPSGVAIEGYDTVAYHTEKRAVEGKQKLRHDWNGASWYFSTEENRDLFRKNPRQYAPQYGGYCAYALAAKDELTSSAPAIWKVTDGKLFLFANPEALRIWNKRQKKLAGMADRYWSRRVRPAAE